MNAQRAAQASDPRPPRHPDPAARPRAGLPHRPVFPTLAVLALAITAACAPTGIDYKIESAYAVNDPQFERTMGTLLGPPLTPGNSAVTFLNGDEIFPAMLADIAAAKETINFETFVFWSGTTGKSFADAISERARAGIRVHVLIDAIGGSKVDQAHIAEMRDAGAQVEFYHALKWFDVGSAARLNNRTHRKLLILDGSVAFTGGVGIADEWQGHAQDSDHWRDTHYRVQGPVVGQMQAAFMDTWMEVTGQVLHDSDYFPPLPAAGHMLAQFFMSSFRGGSENMHLMYLLSFAASRANIRLSSAYFVPDQVTSNTLIEARRRGVRVQIIVPGPFMDREYVREASRARWGDLLEAGVEIYEYQPTMYHSKLMVVDDLWTSVGSSNLDNRSFTLNDEANLNILDANFAAQQTRVFDDDLKCSRLVTLESWGGRPVGERMADHTASLMGSQF